jgi:Skp family chaperone for outer membrane proteins
MKKVLFVVLAFMVLLFAGTSVKAQAIKVGVFDIDIMLQAMPGYRGVDSLLQIYEQDSLRGEYDFAMREYNRLDSTYKSDSTAKAPASVLNYVKQQRNEIATTIIYWQQISQRKTEGKRQELAGPLYERIIPAYQKVIRDNNYLVVLKPDAIEFIGSSKVENLFEKVAKELKITLPEGLRSAGEPEQPAPAAKTPAAARPATTPRKQ